MAKGVPQFVERAPAQLSSWVIVVCVIVLVAVLEYANVLGPIRRVLEVGVQPFLKAGTRVVHTVKFPVEWVRIATQKYTYILDLELRYAESAAQLSELERLRLENESLRQLLEGEQATPSGLVSQRRVAAVLSYAQPTVGLGSEDGVAEGNLVFVRGVVVGKIVAVSAHQSQVKLLNTFGESDVLLVQTEAGISGLVSGNGQEILLKEIPIDAPVEVGQRVETSGQVGVLPKLYLGRVLTVRREEGAPTQTAVIDQGVSFYRTTVVEVLP